MHLVIAVLGPLLAPLAIPIHILTVNLLPIVQEADFQLPDGWGVFLAAVAAALPVVSTWLTQALKSLLGDDGPEISSSALARWVAVGVYLAAVVIGPVNLPGEFSAPPAQADPMLILAWLTTQLGIAAGQVGFIDLGSRFVYDTWLKPSVEGSEQPAGA